MKPLKLLLLCIAGLLLAFLIACWGGVLWLESPGGARQVSQWITAQVGKKAAGTEVVLEELDVRWPLRVRVKAVHWNRQGAAPILIAKEVVLSGNVSAWLKGSRRWRVKGRIERLDLEALDRSIAGGEWRTRGSLSGWVDLWVSGSSVEKVNLQVDARPPGGDMDNELLGRLLEMMPQGDAKTVLLKSIRQKALFHFDVGRMELATEGDHHRLSLLLDGDHLLDITVRIPKKSLRLFENLMEGFR